MLSYSTQQINYKNHFTKLLNQKHAFYAKLAKSSEKHYIISEHEF